ncbi:tyrosine-type recombinase/integrase [Methanomethylovorans sp.]|uniref:tyrosine-type recombinase/integrase n=1 Tax=Methanomethylovorans sp. TaxID=2758717 RepID=UPI00351C1261
MSELRNDPIGKDWIETLNPKPNTERNYLLAMQTFTDWINKTPGELLTEAEDEIRAGKLMRERNVKRHLVGFRKYMQDSGYAPISVKNYLTGVKSFYRVFDIEIPTLPRAGNKARPLERNCKIPVKEDIQTVLKVADPLERAIVLVGVSSGLAANEVLSLTVGQFKHGYDPATEITTLTLRRAKVGYDFVTFLTPEASRAVWDYLTYRERESKTNEIRRLNQLDKQKVRSDSDYLFCCRWVPDEYLTDYDERKRKLEHHSFMKVFRILSEKAAKCAPAGHWNLIRSHNLRKYFNSALLNAGADSFFVEFTMGHTLDDTRSAYFRATPEKMRDIYRQYIPFLTIQKELDISESPEYQSIKKENVILQAETARHVVERSELAAVKAELDEMKKHQQAFNEVLARLQDKPELFMHVLKKVEKG